MNLITEYPGSALLYIMVIIIVNLLSMMANLYKRTKLGIAFLIMIIVVLSLLSGLRSYSVGTDTLNYVTHINYWQTIQNYNRYPTEPGLRFISILTAYFFKGPTSVLLVVATLTNSLIVYRLWTYKNNISINISILLYSLYYYFMTLSGIRQWVAISIVFWASEYVFKKKYLRFSFFVILATLFHNSAIIGLLIPIVDIILNKKKYNIKKLIFFLFVVLPSIIGVLIVIESKFNIFSKYGAYFENFNAQVGTGITLWIKMFLSLIIFLVILSEKIISEEDYNLFKRSFTIYFIGLLMVIPGYYINDFNRIAFYYVIYELIFFGVIGKYYKNMKVKIGLLMFILFYVLLFILEIKYSGLSIMPYKFYWNEAF